MTETQPINNVGLKFIVDKYGLIIKFDNGVSISLNASKFENHMTIQKFVDKFCSYGLQELQYIKMYYCCKRWNGVHRFIIEHGIFYMCGDGTDDEEFLINFPITEQFHSSLVKMLKDICNLWTDDSCDD